MSFVDEMTKTERVMAAVNGDEVDRVPVCFWHHFRPEGSGRRLAEATFNFFEATFDLDILKIMPDIPYPFPRRSVTKPDDWLLIEPTRSARATSPSAPWPSARSATWSASMCRSS